MQNRKALINMAPGESEFSWHGSLQRARAARPDGRSDFPNWSSSGSCKSARCSTSSCRAFPALHPASRERALMSRCGSRGQVKRLASRCHVQQPVGRDADHRSGAADAAAGLRSSDAALRLRLRTSRGSQRSAKLPEGATVEAVSEGATSARCSKMDATFAPACPLASAVRIKWRQAGGHSLLHF